MGWNHKLGIALDLPPPKKLTNMTGWKLGHEWRCSFPIENGGFSMIFQCQVSFQGCILVEIDGNHRSREVGLCHMFFLFMYRRKQQDNFFTQIASFITHTQTLNTQCMICLPTIYPYKLPSFVGKSTPNNPPLLECLGSDSSRMAYPMVELKRSGMAGGIPPWGFQQVDYHPVCWPWLFRGFESWGWHFLPRYIGIICESQYISGIPMCCFL